MALPSYTSPWFAGLERHQQWLVHRREEESRSRQQWELASRYFHHSRVCAAKQDQWASRKSFQMSMSAFDQREKKEEQEALLERRKHHLRDFLRKEQEVLTEELRALRLHTQEEGVEAQRRKGQQLKGDREQRTKQVAEERLYECWKKNSARLREVESELHQKHVVGAWADQKAQKIERETAKKKETIRAENNYEVARREALQRIKEEEERRKEEARKCAEALRQQMEELMQREEEAKRLKEEEEALLKQKWEVEALEAERKHRVEGKKKDELRRFLKHQFQAQMKRQAEQVQEELEADRRLLCALSEEEEEEAQRRKSARKQEAQATVTWMKEVLEQQERLERERQADAEALFQEEAKAVWEKREAEWEKERNARNRLMEEVLCGRRMQIEERVSLNREAQQQALQRRQEIIEEMEEDQRKRKEEEEKEEAGKTARREEIQAQVMERQHKMVSECLQEEEEEAVGRLEEEQKAKMEADEAQRMTKRGFQHRCYGLPRTAWN